MKLKMKKNPCRAVCDKLQITNLPNKFSNVRKIEKVLIAKGLLFKNIMPHAQFSEFISAICNVAIKNVDENNLLPRQSVGNRLVIV